MKKVCFSLLMLMFSFLFVTGQKLSGEEYIFTYRNLAMMEMNRSGVPASITLAQGMIETESGNSSLLFRSNNHFGIKCKSNWNGPSVSHDDDAPEECFRAYQSAEESYRDHSDFLRNSPRYAFLFDLPATDYRGWAEGLKQAGYATNPRYPEILIRYIETYNLQEYDTKAIIDASTKLAGLSIEPPQDVVPEAVAAIAPKQNPLPFSTHEINSLKAVFVPGGTSLLAIATKYNIKLLRLIEFNDLKKDGILPKAQFIFLEKKRTGGETDYYTSDGNETLYDVAQINGVLLQSLLEYNSFGEDQKLPAGAKVYLKKSVTIASGSINTGNENSAQISQNKTPREMIIHQVQAKEGLYSISKQYGVSVEALKHWNNLQDDKLQIGQRINILK